MKKLFYLIPVFFIGAFLFMGQKANDLPEKWNIVPQQTGIIDPNVNSAPPIQQEYDYVNQNTVTRYISDPNGVFAVGPNFRVLPRTNSYQSEVIITRHPLNPLIMFGSSNAVNFVSGTFISEGVYVTTNGGLNWFGSDSLRLSGGAPAPNQGGDPGIAIDKNGTFIQTHLGNAISGMYANYSTDNGISWSANFTIATGSQDKNLAATDDAPSSPYYGRSYVVWSLFSVASPPIAVSYTTNGGVSWSAAAQINTSVAGHYSQGCDIRVGPNGEVYVIWAAPNTSAANVEDFAGFAKSTNGGVTWTVTDNAYDMNGIRGTFPSKSNIRVNGFTRIDVDRSGGPRNGWIYTVAAEKNLAPAGSDPDVVLHRSTNGGTTWSAGVRVNQDALNNGKFQYLPAIRVDENGGVNIVYYDDRNTTSDSVSVFMSRSLDGGFTWTDTQVSDHNSKPAPIAGLATGYQGDYIGITSGNGKIWPLWSDNSTSGIYQAWTTYIDIGPGITHTPLPNTEQISGNYAVNCVITPSGSGINPSKTKLFWSRNNVAVTDSLLMTNSSGTNWTANIPGNGAAATYRYYITTTDSLSRTSTSPNGAPGILNLFIASTDVTKPVIVHTALTNQPKPNWPATVTATVTDNLGIDSSWVRWNINSGTTKQFKLINTTGSTFTAAFNSLNADVIIGDVINYRIIAQDNSLAHNRDSSALFSFNIIDQVLCEDFTSATFAPTSWNIEFTGTNYWTRNSVSGYGVGTGSAKFDFWNAPAATTQSLVTLTFAGSVSGDSLKYDYAYAPYTSGTDSLEIQTSTNSGTSYTSLVRLFGNATSGIGGNSLNTTTTLSSLFTPTSGQWLNKKFALPVGTNKIKFRARSGFGNNLYIDNPCKVNSSAPVPATITFAAEGYFDTLNTKLNIRDSATFYLRNTFAPYTIVDSGKSVIDSITASGTITFANAVTGTYYLVVKGRNILETWSKAGGELYTRGSAFSYNFTTAANKAYGNNLVLKGSRYCIYSGEIIKNNAVDLNDIIEVNNAASLFTSGFNVNDLTGNRLVDLSDILIAYNNSSSFVTRQAPAGAGPLEQQESNTDVKKSYQEVIEVQKYEEQVLIQQKNDEKQKDIMKKSK